VSAGVIVSAGAVGLGAPISDRLIGLLITWLILRITAGPAGHGLKGPPRPMFRPVAAAT
jgi:hypothetical protein